MALAGLAIGLVTAELAFRYRDDGAFPHLNCYVADDQLGVRLEPGATERVAFGGNPTTSVRINAQGYRGADWPAPTPGEIVVVGDSQVFGLGVEEDDTFSAGLATRMHRSVLDAGVPTYGPGEYRTVISELLAARHPSVVVLAINLVNDLFELNHPNTTRHAVWDGWAVRKENAPDSVTEFPGRRWLFADSHLVFAWRTWWGGSDLAAGGVASEGTWNDLVAQGDTTVKQRDALRAELATPGLTRLTADEEVARTDRQIEDEYSRNQGYRIYRGGYASSANVGDIVSNNFAEVARSVVTTSELISYGEEARKYMRAQVEAWARSQDSAKLHALLTARDAAIARRDEVEDERRLAESFEPPLLPYIRDVRKLVEAGRARLVVVVLPIDVQVSDAEWAKYGAKPIESPGSAGTRSVAGRRRGGPIDMAATRALSEELASSIARLGITALDAQLALRAAEPGAFLDHDIHMTAKGHAAVAAALADAIAAPPPSPPRPALHVPLPSEWIDAAPLAIADAGADVAQDSGCEARRVRDWMRVMCGRTETRDVPVSIVTSDAGALALVTPYQVSLVVHLEHGQVATGTIGWEDRTRAVTLSLDTGVALAPFVKIAGRHAASGLEDEYGPVKFYLHRFVSPASQALCRCWNQELGDHGGDASCSGAYGAPIDRCARDYATSCAQMIACSWREPGL